MYQELKYFHCHPVEDDYARRGITEIRGPDSLANVAIFIKRA